MEDLIFSNYLEDPSNGDDCYFSLNNISGLNFKKTHKFVDNSVDSLIAPVSIEWNERGSVIELRENIGKPDESEWSCGEYGSSVPKRYQSKTESAVSSLMSQS